MFAGGDTIRRCAKLPAGNRFVTRSKIWRLKIPCFPFLSFSFSRTPLNFAKICAQGTQDFQRFLFWKSRETTDFQGFICGKYFGFFSVFLFALLLCQDMRISFPQRVENKMLKSQRLLKTGGANQNKNIRLFTEVSKVQNTGVSCEEKQVLRNQKRVLAR